MKLLTDWGFSVNSWQGQRGEYWVLAQAIAILSFIALPVYVLPSLTLSPPERYGLWCVAAVLGLFALTLVVKGLLDLGHSLTPLHIPKTMDNWCDRASTDSSDTLFIVDWLRLGLVGHSIK